jgi:hypothetical protein
MKNRVPSKPCLEGSSPLMIHKQGGNMVTNTFLDGKEPVAKVVG